MFPVQDVLTKTPEELQVVLDSFDNQFDFWKEDMEENLGNLIATPEFASNPETQEMTKELQFELNKFEGVLDQFTDEYFENLQVENTVDMNQLVQNILNDFINFKMEFPMIFPQNLPNSDQISIEQALLNFGENLNLSNNGHRNLQHGPMTPPPKPKRNLHKKGDREERSEEGRERNHQHNEERRREHEEKRKNHEEKRRDHEERRREHEERRREHEQRREEHEQRREEHENRQNKDGNQRWRGDGHRRGPKCCKAMVLGAVFMAVWGLMNAVLYFKNFNSFKQTTIMLTELAGESAIKSKKCKRSCKHSKKSKKDKKDKETKQPIEESKEEVRFMRADVESQVPRIVAT
jgi:hypothetical protein